MRKIILALSIFLFTSTLFAEDHYAIVYIGAKWCGPCQTMRNTVWGTKEVEKFVTKDLLPSTDIQIYDVDADTNKDYVKACNVISLPTTIVMKVNPKGPTFPSEEIGRRVGFQPVQSLFSFLKESIK